MRHFQARPFSVCIKSRRFSACRRPIRKGGPEKKNKEKNRATLPAVAELCRQDQSASAPAELHMSFPNRWARNRWNFQKFTSHAQHRMFYTPILSLFSATVVSKLCIPDDDHQNYRARVRKILPEVFPRQHRFMSSLYSHSVSGALQDTCRIPVISCNRSIWIRGDLPVTRLAMSRKSLLSELSN